MTTTTTTATAITTIPRGKVYVASMNMRGEWAGKTDPNSITVNVTSAQAKASKNRRDFSPMTHIEGESGYHGYWNFESRWQAGKIFEGIDEAVTKAWWKAQNEPKRRYPKGKGKKILYARFEGHEDKGNMDYITARKEVYVKEYLALIRNREMIQYYKKMLDEGKSITLYDFDGPRMPDRSVMCLELTRELYDEKINYLDQPFGHVYVVGGVLTGLLE